MALTIFVGDAELKLIGKVTKGKLVRTIFTAMAKKELQLRTYEFTGSDMAYNDLNLYFREIHFVVSRQFYSFETVQFRAVLQCVIGISRTRRH